MGAVKLSFLAGAAAGYVLGTRAGRERYETIVRLARRLRGSQTFQSTAGVLRGQLDVARREIKKTAASKLHGETYPVSDALGRRGTSG